jgi:hypothetical protein
LASVQVHYFSVMKSSLFETVLPAMLAVTGDARNPAAGRPATNNLKLEENNETFDASRGA